LNWCRKQHGEGPHESICFQGHILRVSAEGPDVLGLKGRTGVESGMHLERAAGTSKWGHRKKSRRLGWREAVSGGHRTCIGWAQARKAPRGES